MDLLDVLPHAIILTIVLTAEVLINLKARELAGPPEGDVLDRLRSRLEHDLLERAAMGVPPDWARYGDELDRFLEPRDDGLRRLASSALAIGLGGTILALLFSLMMGLGGDGTGITVVLRALSFSLLGSAFGIANNVWLVVWYLPRAEAGFLECSEQFLGELREVWESIDPDTTLTGALRDSVSQAFTEAMGVFPSTVENLQGAIDGLGERITTLEDVFEKQGDAISGIQASADAVSSAGRSLQPLDSRLTTATEELQKLPDRLTSALETSRDQWVEGIQKQQEASLDELLRLQKEVEARSVKREEEVMQAFEKARSAFTTAVADMDGHVQEVRTAVEGLPANLATGVKQVAGLLGNEFGQRASDSVERLGQVVSERIDKLQTIVTEHEQLWCNNIEVFTDELYANKIRPHLQESLVTPMTDVSQQLKEMSESLTPAAAELRAAHAEWLQSQTESLTNWQQTGAAIRAGSEQAGRATAGLTGAVTSIHDAAASLERVASASTEFQNAIIRSLALVNAQHLESLGPVRDEVQSIARSLRPAQERMDSLLATQSEFVRHCIELVMEGLDGRTSQRDDNEAT